MKKTILLLAFLITLSCSENNKKINSEWISLFDGSSLKGWRAYNGDQMPPGWKIVDSILTFSTAQILEKITIILGVETLFMEPRNLKTSNCI